MYEFDRDALLVSVDAAFRVLRRIWNNNFHQLDKGTRTDLESLNGILGELRDNLKAEAQGSRSLNVVKLF